MYYLGIDISRKSFTVSILDEEGKAISKALTFLCTGVKGSKNWWIRSLP